MRAEPLEPEVAAALEAIDATLHGEPADPQFAELTELSLILRADRPQPEPAFLHRLEQDVAGGFTRRQAPRRARGWLRGAWAASLGSATAVVAAVVLVVVLVHAGSHPSAMSSASSSSSSAASVPATAGASSGSSSSAGAAAGPGTAVVPRSEKSVAPAPVPKPSPGRQITQSARLTLVAGPGQLDRVARQVFSVVGAEHGYVSGSQVDSVPSTTSTAHFTLRVPSARLERTLNRLSALTDARVSSRSDSSHDVTARIDGDGAQLTQSRATRRALLRQLAAAETSREVLTDERALRRNRTTIAADETALAKLRRRVSYSAITVLVSGPPARTHRRHHVGSGGGLSLGRGLHDAGRVLVVAASIALIVLAVLIPLSVLGGLVAWVWLALRHRRREQALGPRG